MEKTVLIDTNLYLDDPNIIKKLATQYDKILIPVTVLKELDKKKYHKDLSYSARHAIQAILDFTSNNIDQVIFDIYEYSDSDPDGKIISSAKKYSALLATKDISMSIIAKSVGLETMIHDVVMNNIFNPYIYVDINDLYNAAEEDVFAYDQEYIERDYANMLVIFSKIAGYELNEDFWWFIIINAEINQPILYANNPIKHKLIRIDNKPEYREIRTEGSIIKALDCYQVCAIYAMIEAPNALICGSYGSGKSLLASAYAIANNNKKTFISRPNLTVDRRFDLGFLPGPQPLDAKILTPTGWTTMGKIKKGDYIIGYDGKATKVIETYNKGIKDVYRINTTNGGSTKACGEHIWATKTHSDLKHNKSFKLKTTLEIKETLLNPNKGPEYNHTLPMNGIVEYNSKKELPIPPYTLGVLLGDGSIANTVSFSSTDDEIIERVRKELELYELILTKHGISYTIRGNYYGNKPAKPVKMINTETNEITIYTSTSEASISIGINKGTISGRCTHNYTINNYTYSFLKSKRWRNYLKNALYELGILGKYAHDKHIPDIYKYSSIENRTALLQGLMDTDGTIKESTGEQTFTTVSKRLAEDIIELSRSLGINATYHTRNRIGKTTIRPTGGIITSRFISYEVSIPKSKDIDVFYLKRKLNRSKLPTRNKHVKINSIEYIGKEQVKCLLIDNESHLYITDDFIVTHNTMVEKLSPWMAGFISSLYYIFSNTKGQTTDKMSHKGMSYDFVKDQMFQKYFEMMPLDSLQGTSFMDGDLLLLDETQLCSVSILSVILSRFGRGSKLIMTGDIGQVYNVIPPSENGLLKLLRLLPSKHIAYVTLKNNYRSGLVELAEGLQDKSF